jgi:microsomal dipeptidase-like Zn-dependent dipeptidase
MLVDLHAHYPMHVIPDDQPQLRERPGAFENMLGWDARRKAQIIDRISERFNYEGQDLEHPSVTINGMVGGDVRIALSVLYQPFDEIKLGTRPVDGSTDHIFEQMNAVEDSIAPGVAGHRSDVIPVKSAGDLERAARGEVYGLVHCIEGGFSLGPDESAIAGEVEALAKRGLGYVTVAHLLWRRYATNAPALPFFPDWVYHAIFWQPWWRGLSRLGKAAVEAMVANRVLVDVSHMSGRAIKDVLEIVRASPGTPVIASHSATRLGRRSLGYNLSRTQVQDIARVGGVVGLILCSHYISHGQPELPEKATIEDSMPLLFSHIDKIVEWTGGSFDHVGIGSDLDGFIKPALPGLKDMDNMADLQVRLADRYGPESAEKISSGNALRMLRYRFGG